MTFQLHFFDEAFQQLQNNMFARVGRSLIVNKRYIHVINLTEQILIFSGQQIKSDIRPVNASREALKQLKELLENQSDTHRLGYMAMLGNNSVIGISRSEKVKDFVEERGGSFFRQFILVSDGTIPSRFFLHGKVERRAIGRIGDQLYFIATRHKETLWDFADALRELLFLTISRISRI